MPTPTRFLLVRGAPVLAALVLGACGGSSGTQKIGLGGRCTNTAACADPYVCTSGTCQYASGEGAPCPNGDECQAPLVCKSGSCAANEGATCTGQAQCASSLVCYTGTCVRSEPESPTCAASAAGAMPPIVGGGTVSASDPGTSCRLPVTPADPNPGRNLGVIAFGEKPVGTNLSFPLPEGSTGFSIISQEKPGTAPDSIDFKTSTQTVTVPNSVVPTLIRDPSGTVLWDDINVPSTQAEIEASPIYYGGVTEGTGALTVANTPVMLDRLYTAGALPAGNWQFTVNDWAYECTDRALMPYCGPSGSTAGVYDTTVLTRPGPLASTGTLDLAIYLVMANGPTAANGKNDPHVQRFVKSIAAYLGRAGLCVGTVTLYDVPDWAKTKYASLVVDDDPKTPDINEGGVCGPLAQMFTLSQGANAMQLFLVDELRSARNTTNYVIAGIDGSIPGPSAVQGTINSGAAVGVGTTLAAGSCAGDPNLNSCGADFLAYVSAHEIGHWLGLYHATEQNGETFDPLTDTATCSCSLCAKTAAERTACSGGSVMMDATYCDGSADPVGCGGADNLMFWLVDQNVSVGNLTRQQGEVARLNPLVR